MKYCLLLLISFNAWAQTDVLSPVPNPPASAQNNVVRSRYYEMDRRHTDMGRHVLASGNVGAITEYKAQVRRQRRLGRALLIAGGLIMVAGLTTSITAQAAPPSTSPFLTTVRQLDNAGRGVLVVNSFAATIVGTGWYLHRSDRHYRNAVQRHHADWPAQPEPVR